MHERIWCSTISSNNVCNPLLLHFYLVGSGYYQCEITVVMNQQHKYANVPLVCQVAEHYQKYRQRMVQSILEEVSFRSDEYVTKETTEVLPALTDVEHFHLQGHLCYCWSLFAQTEWTAEPTQPSGHERCPQHYFVGPYRWEEIVYDWVAPLHQRKTPFLSGLGLQIFVLSYVVFKAKRIEVVMNKPVHHLHE